MCSARCSTPTYAPADAAATAASTPQRVSQLAGQWEQPSCISLRGLNSSAASGSTWPSAVAHCQWVIGSTSSLLAGRCYTVNWKFCPALWQPPCQRPHWACLAQQVCMVLVGGSGGWADSSHGHTLRVCLGCISLHGFMRHRHFCTLE